MSTMRQQLTRALLAITFLLGTLAPMPTLAVPPTADLHDLEWFVHVDLIDAGAGRDLAYYQGLIDAAMSEATTLIEGTQGPVDAPCCTRLIATASVATFGTTGDGLDVLDSAADYAVISGLGISSQAFLVDSLTYCGGSAPTSIGCAVRPSCDLNGNDDPDLYLVVTVDAFDSNILGKVLAHERGHNACLTHIDTDECQLMRSGGGGGCLTATECSNLGAGRTTTGGSCTCHDGAGNIEPDNNVCTEVASGVCSGGQCGASTGIAGITLLGSAGPESANGEVTDEAFRMSALTSNWSSLGLFAPTGEEVKGMAYATDSSTLFGVVPGSGDDQVVTIDPTTGSLTIVGTIANGTRELVALAYSPGATSASTDDLLFALDSDGSFENLVSIDPASPNALTIIGPLAFGAPNGFRGLAYDSTAGRLYAASPFVDGIYEVSMTCSPFCGLTQQNGLNLSRSDASLSYSPLTQRLYLVGTQIPVTPLGRRYMFNEIDPVAMTKGETRTLDSATPAALAAVPKLPICSDGIDNDGDGFTDFPADPGCQNANSEMEVTECQDGIDNDGNLGTDFDGGVSILGAGNGDPAGADPQCTGNGWRNSELTGPPPGCGLGPELALLLPLLAGLRRRVIG